MPLPMLLSSFSSSPSRTACGRAPLSRALMTLCLLLSTLFASTAYAACPAGDPCENVLVYRVQTWPGLLTDAKGRDLLSLQEANAGSKGAFKDVLAGYGGSTSLALRFTVTRITSAPNGYCNCNFELAGKACKTGDLNVLKQCDRVCRYNGAADNCVFAGTDVKVDGAWYAFPASTRCLTQAAAPAQAWKKNAFGVVAKNCDWYAAAPLIKRASCIATAIKADPHRDLDALFADDALCPVVTSAEIQQEAIPR